MRNAITNVITITSGMPRIGLVANASGSCPSFSASGFTPPPPPLSSGADRFLASAGHAGPAPGCGPLPGFGPDGLLVVLMVVVPLRQHVHLVGRQQRPL